MSLSEHISPLLGRLILAWFFLSQAWAYAHGWDANVTLLAMKHIPVPALLLLLSLVVMVLGGLSLALGFHARHGALLLFAFTMIASFALHDFWHVTNAADKAADYDLFARNMAIAGGLLMIVGLGPGAFAIDGPGKKKG